MSAFNSATMGAPPPKVTVAPRFNAASAPAPHMEPAGSAPTSKDQYVQSPAGQSGRPAVRGAATTRSVAIGALPFLAMIDGGVSLLLLGAGVVVGAGALKLWQIMRDSRVVGVCDESEENCAAAKTADGATLHALEHTDPIAVQQMIEEGDQTIGCVRQGIARMRVQLEDYNTMAQELREEIARTNALTEKVRALLSRRHGMPAQGAGQAGLDPTRVFFVANANDDKEYPS